MSRALPEIRTVDDLRSALSRDGFPGDRERFEEELAAAVGASPTNDFAGATAVVRAYRHRVLIRNSPEIMAALRRPWQAYVTPLLAPPDRFSRPAPVP